MVEDGCGRESPYCGLLPTRWRGAVRRVVEQISRTASAFSGVTGKSGEHRRGSLHKQFHGGVRSERREREFLLAINPQTRAAGDQDFKGRARFQYFGNHRGGREYLFEVVQQEQEGAGIP